MTRKTTFAALLAAPLLALGGGLAYAGTSSGGGTAPTPAVTTTQTSTPAPTPSTGQYPTTPGYPGGNWYYSNGHWCCGDNHTGQNQSTTGTPGYQQGNGQYGYNQQTGHHNTGGCWDR